MCTNTQRRKCHFRRFDWNLLVRLGFSYFVRPSLYFPLLLTCFLAFLRFHRVHLVCSRLAVGRCYDGICGANVTIRNVCSFAHGILEWLLFIGTYVIMFNPLVFNFNVFCIWSIVHAQAYASCFAKDDSICRGFVTSGREKMGRRRDDEGLIEAACTIAGTSAHHSRQRSGNEQTEKKSA